MGQLNLEGMAFYAHHGYYTEERKRGNNYLVDVQISYNMEQAGASDNLHDAINYETVYQVCQRQMDNPRHLIETVAKSIAEEIKNAFPDTEYVRIELKKLKPELGGPVHHASVVYVL
ncbi:MAG TPA: dihydroneopterin aldolase [Saprospiraceae bacterium]|nr:dihydroneopterin aldolase [Saprospiraceae bacterium]